MLAAWLWVDAAEDIAFGLDILLSAAAALATDLHLFDAAPGDLAGAERGRGGAGDAPPPQDPAARAGVAASGVPGAGDALQGARTRGRSCPSYSMLVSQMAVGCYLQPCMLALLHCLSGLRLPRWRLC